MTLFLTLCLLRPKLGSVQEYKHNICGKAKYSKSFVMFITHETPNTGGIKCKVWIDARHLYHLKSALFIFHCNLASIGCCSSAFTVPHHPALKHLGRSTLCLVQTTIVVTNTYGSSHECVVWMYMNITSFDIASRCSVSSSAALPFSESCTPLQRAVGQRTTYGGKLWTRFLLQREP